MALQLYALKILAPHLEGASVLSLSYPDLLVEPAEFEEAFGYKPTAFTDAGKHHGRKHPLPETVEFFHQMGASLRCVDIKCLRGIEDIVDLNEPQDLGSYDLVINPGTLEHCFNIGTGMMSSSNAVKMGGRIYHEMPMGMMNHGFYNICPTMIYDFYTQNDWEIESFVVATKDGGAHVSHEFATKRHKLPPESHFICMAKRRTEAALRWPVQSKYLEMLK
jgi:hypothetical protein